MKEKKRARRQAPRGNRWRKGEMVGSRTHWIKGIREGEKARKKKVKEGPAAKKRKPETLGEIVRCPKKKT